VLQRVLVEQLAGLVLEPAQVAGHGVVRQETLLRGRVLKKGEDQTPAVGRTLFPLEHRPEQECRDVGSQRLLGAVDRHQQGNCLVELLQGQQTERRVEGQDGRAQGRAGLWQQGLVEFEGLVVLPALVQSYGPAVELNHILQLHDYLY
jgi:hypothetical protein